MGASSESSPLPSSWDQWPARTVRSVSIDRISCVVETRDPDRCYDDIAAAVLDRGIAVSALTSPDNNLGAVFEYLTGDQR